MTFYDRTTNDALFMKDVVLMAEVTGSSVKDCVGQDSPKKAS